MKFFSRKSKNKAKPLGNGIPDHFRPDGAVQPPRFPPTRGSAYLLSQLPPAVLERIFVFVCPHARDESYESCETSAHETGCMLCDLRDLAHCVQVCRAWRPVAVKVLYHSVRIDPVHYCKLEAFLAEKRKKTSRFDRNGVPEDPAQARLRLLRRTVRDDPTRIGKLVEYLKMPYMLRESCHVELAQTIAVLPNLRYVDLPEGMFSDEPHYATLRLEVQARCPNLRKMTYIGGSEKSLAMLATGRVWPQIEVLELKDIKMDAMTIRGVLGSLTNLQALKVSRTPTLSDEVLSSSDGLPTLPPLKELVLKDTPLVTRRGLVEYLAWHETQQALTVLTLKDTGVHPSMLQEILTMATSLKTLAIQAKVAEAFPKSSNIRLLSSKSLDSLRYEISSVSETSAYSNITTGYYSYLSSSILAGGFPSLRSLYVEDDTFPDQLQGLPPPNAAFAEGHFRNSSNSSNNLSPQSPGFSPNQFLSPQSSGRSASNSTPPRSNRLSSNNPYLRASKTSPPPPIHTLEVFTKSDEYGKWNFARVDPFQAPKLTTPKRPVSSYGLATDVEGLGWNRGEARRSVMVGNGVGGFLAIPGQDAGKPGDSLAVDWRPHSSGGEMHGDRDLWR